jgi:hypothetical protein
LTGAQELIYGLLFDLTAETLRTIAADPKHLGARIGVTLVLHTWGSQLTHHPHVHGIVPGGGFALDEDRWVPCKRGFFLSVRVLSRYFRRRFLEELYSAHRAAQLQFFGAHAALADPQAFAEYLEPLRQCDWVVYAKRPFSGPAAVLAYLSRYTHRVAISNSRLIACDERGVTFRWKDYRLEGRTRYKTMTLNYPELLSSPGWLPSPGPRRNRTWRFPPSGSSADVTGGTRDIAHLQMFTTMRAWGRGRLSRRASYRSQVRRARWLRRVSHLNQLRLTCTRNRCRLAIFPLTPK